MSDVSYRYSAFISHSPQDAEFVCELRGYLEAFRLPESLSRQYPAAPRSLTPLCPEGVEGVTDSRFLIVICSENSARPDAEGRNRVNDEIYQFLSLHSEQQLPRILPIILREDESCPTANCLPPLLRLLGLPGSDLLLMGRERCFCDLAAAMLGLSATELRDHLHPRQAAPVLTPDPLREGYRYFAFISYSRRDLAIAHELQRHLEGYRLPAALCEQYPQACRELNPLFRDQNNLGAGPLDVKLREALAASRFLIVICSENSARPNAEGKNYIDEEIRSFLSPDEEKQLAHVIPVIYRRHENCRMSSCLPPVLIEKNMNGYDVLDKGKERCFSDVVATMLGLSIDALWNHYVEDTKPQVACYADYVERHNIPHGLCKLGPEAVERREYHYRITTQGGLVRDVVCCNSAGRPFKPDAEWLQERPVGMRLEYDAQGKVIRQVHTNEHGYDKAEWVFSEGRFIDFQNVGGSGISSLSAQSASELLQEHPFQANTVTRLDVTRDAEGCITQAMFCNIYKRRVANEHGVWGYRCERDALGRITSMLYLDRMGRVQENRKGIAGYQLRYAGPEASAPVESMVCVNSKGHPIPTMKRWSQMQLSYDKQGNLTEKEFQDSLGKPCFELNGYAALHMEYNECGNRVLTANFGADGRPCLDKAGRAGHRNAYDECGHCISMLQFGLDGKPCLSVARWCQASWRYDERGNCLEASYFNEEGKPCLLSGGYSRMTWRYDERGNILEQSWFGTDGKPGLHVNGYATLLWEYDEDGRELSRKSLDTEGKLCPDGDGYAVRLCRYDERGNLTEEACFGADGKPCLDNTRGYASIIRCYDDKGNNTEQRFLGVDGRPCLNKQGYAAVTAVYDQRGYIVEESFRGTDDKLCRTKKGYARYTNRYNEQGYCVEQSYFDAEGQPCLADKGCARITWQYDERGHKTEQAHFGTDGEPCLNDSGCFRFTCVNDERGHVLDTRYFGTDGRPCTDKRGNLAVQWAHDECGNHVETLYIKPDGMVRNRWDKNGKLIEHALLDSTGSPCTGKDGFSRVTFRNNEKGHCTESAYYGEDGRPCLCKDGYSRATYVCDEKGNTLEARSYDTQGKPCMSSYGFCRKVSRYDERGLQVEACYFDTQDQLCLCTAGYARHTWRYNAQGKLLEEAYLDTEGKLINDKESGRALIRRAYDERGNKLEEAYVDAAGKPAPNKDGFTRVSIRYNEANRVLEKQYIYPNGTHVIHYNEEGTIVDKQFTPAQEKPRQVLKPRPKPIINLKAASRPTPSGSNPPPTGPTDSWQKDSSSGNGGWNIQF